MASFSEEQPEREKIHVKSKTKKDNKTIFFIVTPIKISIKPQNIFYKYMTVFFEKCSVNYD